MNLKLKSLALATVLSLATVGAASAGPLWEFTTAGNSFNNNNWDFATAFSVTSDLTATGLGYYADPFNGQVHNNPVGLFECANADCSTTATLIASAIVDNTNPLTGHFRYVTIAPVLLQAGKSYEVAGVSFGNNYTWNDAGFNTDANISLIQLTSQVGRWNVDADGLPTFLNFGQDDISGQDGFWGPNVFTGQPTFVPEPATLGLLGLGLVGVARRFRKQTAR